MPKNKDAIKRYRIIHNTLKSGFKYKSSRLAEICNERLGLDVSWRTIQGDLKDLAEDTELAFFLPIVKERQYRDTLYFYSEIPKSMFPSLELDNEEISALMFYAKTVNQYQGYPMFNSISDAIKKVIENSNIEPDLKKLFDESLAIQTEKHEPIRGTDLIAQLLNSIHHKKVIAIDYQKFTGSELKRYNIKPMLLKEDKHMWYLLGETVESDFRMTLALDRIVSIAETNQEFDSIPFNHDDYYKYSFGITVKKDEPVEVQIKFTSEQGKYVKTLPIHPSQQIFEDTSQNLIINVFIKPSYEFYSKILSYGPDATVISPEYVRNEIKEHIKNSLNNY